MKILNSCIMPVPGLFRNEAITRDEFLSSLLADPSPTSYIGYQQNCDLIARWTGGKVRLPVSHESTPFEVGDVALVMRLDYRAPIGTKGRRVGEEDFSFFRVTRLE